MQRDLGIGSAQAKKGDCAAAAEVVRKLRRVDTIVSNSVMIFLLEKLPFHASVE